jgi:hypothetical protein
MPAKLPSVSDQGVLGRVTNPRIPPNVVFWIATVANGYSEQHK